VPTPHLTHSLTDTAAAVLTVGGNERLTPELASRVAAVVAQAESADKGVVLLLLGGDAAPTAQDPAGFEPSGTGIHLVNTWERFLRRLENAPRPTLAVAEGDCTGPALEVLLIADYRLAAPDARLRLAGAEDGAWPGMAVHRLANQIGTSRARRLLLLRPWLSAAEAAGDLVDETAGSTRETRERAAALADELSALPGQEWSIRRRLLFDSGLSYEEALGAHLAACDRSLRRQQPAPATRP
jgi:isomerase DpgB